MADNTNPILYIEELQRLPLRRRRPPVPGSVSVYRSRNGRLRLPAGGYTAGELLLRGPRVVYEVDIARHVADVVCEVVHAAAPLHLEISFAWQVTDPIAIVTNRLTDPYQLCRETLQAYMQRVVDEIGESDSLGKVAPFHVDLPEGVRLSVRQVTRGRDPDASQPDLRPQRHEIERILHQRSGEDSV